MYTFSAASKVIWGGVSLLNKEKKKRLFKVVIGLLLLFVVGGLILLSNSYALFKKEITGRNVELKVGELSYNLESEKLENNQITLKPNSSETFEVTLTSLNEIDSKYELFYKIISPENLENTVDGGYLETSVNPSSGIIESTNSKTIQLVFNNFGNQEVIIEIGVQAGLIQNDIILNEGEVTLKEINFQKQYVYDYTGDYQTFTVPKDGNYKIELWGASSGEEIDRGKGGYTRGNIELTKQIELYIYVGEQGMLERNTSFNGGGSGGDRIVATYTVGYSGGGATDIRLKDETWNDAIALCSRIMIAAGGGGTSVYGYDAGGGSHAGGLIGYNGGYYSGHPYQNQNGKGATQIAGGAKGNNIYNATGTAYAGSFGIGGNNETISSSTGAGGGGGGYYGGGAGGGTQAGGSGQGGGGGSSFISGHAGCIAIKSEEDQTPKVTTYSKIEDSYHYSGKIFNDTIMIDGAGYKWTTTKGEKTDMPTHDLTSTMTGNTGNGYARITYIGE